MKINRTLLIVLIISATTLIVGLGLYSLFQALAINELTEPTPAPAPASQTCVTGEVMRLFVSRSGHPWAVCYNLEKGTITPLFEQPLEGAFDA